jgi:isopenicillin-N N-acyltransferase-like protein
VSAIRTLVLAGDATARGRRHGEAYRADIRRYTEERVHLASNGSWAGRPATRADVLQLAEAMLPAHRAYAPEIYEEMVAMAKAAGISAAEAVIVGGFTDFVDAVRAVGAQVPPPEDDCTAVLVPDSRADGAGWLAQTWDMHDTATEHVIMLELRTDQPARVFTTVGCVAQIGMNAAGLAVGINNLTASDGRVGVTWPFVVRRILQETTVDAAIRCILEAPLAGGHNYLVLDAEGRGANVEAMPTHTAVTPMQHAPLAHSNHVLDSEGQRREAPRPAELQRSSHDRLARALELCQAPSLDLHAVMGMLRDPVICRRSEPPFYMETSGAVVMRPRTRELWAVWRSPLDSAYERFVVG